MKTLKRLAFALGMAVLLSMATASTALADPTIDNATTTTTSNSGRIDDLNRSDADADLYHYMNSLMVQYTLNEVQYDRLNDLFDSAVYYIANTDMTIAQLETYVASVKADMVKVASTDVTTITSEFLAVADNWSTPTVSYGQAVSIVLPIINVGTETLNDLVIEPEVSNDVTKWPFVPDSTGYVQTEPYIPGYVNDQYAYDNRREFTYHFKVRDDVMTGYYELKFKISFRRAGVRAEESTELSVFVHTFGKPESGYIGGNGHENEMPKSRIIVTGYDTDPAKIFSGDTFNLTLHVQNTSQTTAVSNILFELVAASETIGGSSGSAGNSSAGTVDTVSPLLPTSGSNSLYVSRIAPGETTDLNIEMSAKAGLSQKSYVLGLNMTYDSGTQFDLTGKTNISIPIYQEATFDTSTIELAPASINVGSQTNLMFSIYNTGKTSLYNTQVQFEADSIENNMAFVGNLASGATGNVDVMLTGIAPTMDDGTIKIVISYEDEAGNVSTVEKTATLFVNEIMMDDMDMYGEGSGRRGMEEEEESSGMSPLIRGLIIAAAVLVLGAIIAFLVIRSKKKKEKTLHEEDLKDLEEIKDLEEEEAEEKKNAENTTGSGTEDSSDKD
ncbi:MAG: hypothetical protein J5509_05795 [Lachnospiraceae bacterium]|nr:hypothetical protein [Lachnospiraceae bacterium]